MYIVFIRLCCHIIYNPLSGFVGTVLTSSLIDADLKLFVNGSEVSSTHRVQALMVSISFIVPNIITAPSLHVAGAALRYSIVLGSQKLISHLVNELSAVYVSTSGISLKIYHRISIFSQLQLVTWTTGCQRSMLFFFFFLTWSIGYQAVPLSNLAEFESHQCFRAFCLSVARLMKRWH